MNKLFSSGLWLLILFFMIFGFLSRCTNLIDGVPQGKEKLAQNIFLSKYPNFEQQVQQKIKADRPSYMGAYHYEFDKSEQDNFIIVKYGVQGADWLEMINPFNRQSTSQISFSFRVNLVNKDVVPVNCVPNDSWWSSQKIICN